MQRNTQEQPSEVYLKHGERITLIAEEVEQDTKRYDERLHWGAAVSFVLSAIAMFLAILSLFWLAYSNALISLLAGIFFAGAGVFIQIMFTLPKDDFHK